MSKKFFIVFLFWWALIFPDLAINDFTADFSANTTGTFYTTSTASNFQNQVLKNEMAISYDFWLNKILFSKE